MTNEAALHLKLIHQCQARFYFKNKQIIYFKDFRSQTKQANGVPSWGKDRNHTDPKKVDRNFQMQINTKNH